jgi:hypothetical protein
VTDVSSKGLIPQLTEVLSVLTDTQELLLLRVRAATGEHGQAGRRMTRQPLRTGSQPMDTAGLAELRSPRRVDEEFGRTTGETNGTHREFLLEHDGPTSRPVGGTLLSNGKTLADVGDEPGPEITSQSAVADHTTNGAAPPPPSTPREHPQRDPESANGASADRNYNFFDELDARLTDIQDLDPGPEEERPT